jgi:sugar-specific transcriptional regulator TrmB
MTQEWMLKTLVELGFSQQEAEVYLLLRYGPKNAIDISNELKIYKRKVYRILKRLKETKIIEAKPTRPTEFQMIPFDNFLESLIKNCLGEANSLEEKKSTLYSNWKSVTGKVEFSNTEQKKDSLVI